jgi:hypothetical protein
MSCRVREIDQSILKALDRKLIRTSSCVMVSKTFFCLTRRRDMTSISIVLHATMFSARFVSNAKCVTLALSREGLCKKSYFSAESRLAPFALAACKTTIATMRAHRVIVCDSNSHHTVTRTPKSTRAAGGWAMLVTSKARQLRKLTSQRHEHFIAFP